MPLLDVTDEQRKAQIDIINGEGKTWLQRLDDLEEYRKKNLGSLGMHVPLPLDVLCGQRNIDDPGEEAEKIAHDVCLMILAELEGRFVDITDEIMQEDTY